MAVGFHGSQPFSIGDVKIAENISEEGKSVLMQLMVEDSELKSASNKLSFGERWIQHMSSINDLENNFNQKNVGAP